MSRRAGLVVGWLPRSRRAETIADRLGFDLRLLRRLGFRQKWSAPFIYPLMALRTAWLVLRLRPRAVIVVAPPFVAPLLVLPIARLLGARVAVDVHSGALLDPAWRSTLPVLYSLLRRADVAIVTLPSLAERLRARRIDALVMPDPLPRLPVTGRGAEPRADGLPRVVAVCGWGDDEPLEELVEAARGRPFHMSLTGRPRRRLDTPPNVTLTGFLSETDYADLLANADVVVALTTRDETLLCAAWEALSLRRPLVLSSTPAQRSTFGERLAYVRPEPRAIADGIEATLAARAPSVSAPADLADRFAREGDRTIGVLRSRLR